MNILFITALDMNTVYESNIYSDLMRAFIKNGNNVYITCPTAGKEGENTNVISCGDNCSILRVKTDKIQKTNIIRKGITTLLIESQFKNAITKHLSGIKFDVIMYSTPPITFAGVVSFIKKRDGAKSYLLLKDIFPQNAVDIGMMTKSGPKSVIYRFFRQKEKKLYALSDYIGCMSQANADFVLKHNPEIPKEKVHISPNTIEPLEIERSPEKRKEIREKYNVPQDIPVFVYGGNLGKPQDIPFIIECLKANAGKEDRFFVICGTGTEYPVLEEYANSSKQKNLLLLPGLPKAEYDDFIKAFDVGLIFLDKRFTIPNFPSRLLAYMQSKMPVISCTDTSSDIGDVIEQGGFGWKCTSDSVEGFTKTLDAAIGADFEVLGQKGYDYLKQNYTVDNSYDIITSVIGE